MKLLFDQNLSHRLIKSLEGLFPGSRHVRLLGLAEADDLTIWNHAKEHGFVIVTQDSDYPDWNKFLGAPPKIVWLRCGNASVVSRSDKAPSGGGTPFCDLQSRTIKGGMKILLACRRSRTSVPQK